MIRLALSLFLLSLPGEEPAGTDALARAREALDGGIAFLVQSQNEDGSWGYHAQRRPHAIWAPVPGGHRSFMAATTALAVMALRKSGEESDALDAARRKGLEYVLGHARVKRSHGRELYNVWAYGYGLQCLAGCLLEPREGDDAKRIRAVAEELVDALRIYQAVDGGWGYFDFAAKTFHPSGDSMSFTTATILIALNDARRAGIRVPKPMTTAALRCLRRSRTPEGSYIYSFSWRYSPHGGINRHQGSLTRTPGNDLALHLFDAGISKPDLLKAVEILFAKRAFARMALHRPIPHESWFQVSGYFYLFGYYHAAMCCRLLPDADVTRLRPGLIGEILYTRHPDGSFWDYPLYGYDKPYGTAYATMALLDLLEGTEPK